MLGLTTAITAYLRRCLYKKEKIHFFLVHIQLLEKNKTQLDCEENERKCVWLSVDGNESYTNLLNSFIKKNPSGLQASHGTDSVFRMLNEPFCFGSCTPIQIAACYISLGAPLLWYFWSCMHLPCALFWKGNYCLNISLSVLTAILIISLLCSFHITLIMELRVSNACHQKTDMKAEEHCQAKFRTDHCLSIRCNRKFSSPSHFTLYTGWATGKVLVACRKETTQQMHWQKFRIPLQFHQCCKKHTNKKGIKCKRPCPESTWNAAGGGWKL